MANTPNLDLVKPAGTDHALVSVINANSDKIDSGFGTLSEQIAMNSFGTKSTIAALESDLATFGGSMPNNSVRNIVFALDPAQGVFKNANYVGTISRTSSGRYTVFAQSHSSVQTGDLVVGIYANSAWSWGNVALKSELTNKFVWTTFLSESNVSIGNTYASTGKYFTLAKPSLVRAEMSYGSGRPLAIGLKGSETAGSGSVALNSIYGNDISDTSGLAVTALLPAGTYYVWARTASATGSSNIAVYGMPLGA